MEVYNELLEKIQLLLKLTIANLGGMSSGNVQAFMETSKITDFELKSFLESDLHISDTSRRNYGDMVEKIECEANRMFSDDEFYGKRIDRSLLEMELDLEEDMSDEPIVTVEE
jgi:hypothetical protein